MEINEALELIKIPGMKRDQPQIWMDLGCGTGLFTRALAVLLPGESIIHAIDRNEQSIPNPPDENVKINFICSDFVNDDLALKHVDGVLMANSLHFIEDHFSFLSRLISTFISLREFIIVEYDMIQANPWVPYPVNAQKLKKIFYDLGFQNVVKIAERKSIYRRANLYSCHIKKN